MKTRLLALGTCLLLPGCVPAVGQLLPSLWVPTRVTRVIDGDTYEVLTGGQKKRLRLLNVDCPEVTQPFGRQATDSVKRLLPVGRVVLVRTSGTDLYGRLLGRVRLPVAPVLGAPPAPALDSVLVARGWAWATGTGGALYTGPWVSLQTAATNARRGLWKCYSAETPIVPPARWRSFNKQNKILYRGTCTW